MTKENEMDSGELPAYLPILRKCSLLGPMGHVHLEAKRIRGLQHQYTGHTCTVCIMNKREGSKLYDTLPLLPSDLDVLLPWLAAQPRR